MAQLLLELFSEEIPARMQAKAEADLGKVLGDALTAAGLDFDELQTASGPRRLAVVVDGLPKRSADVREERKGPKVGAPEKAVAGFLRGAGLGSIDEAEVRVDPKKGEFYVAVIEKAGRAATDIIAGAVPEIVRKFHWPKSMRWGTGDLRWVRPLQRIVCVLDGAVVPFEIDGLASGNETEGHRVHGRGPFVVSGWEDYQSQLEGAGYVMLARADRKALIAKRAEALCKKAGLELVPDEGLLEEVTGLAEWPVPVLGEMDAAFLDLPPEVVRLSMRTHQKYFAVRDPKTGKLAPNFVTVANIEAADGGAKIAAGNAKVLSARLDDARFFWDNDKKTGLDAMVEKLGKIEFKKELGSVAVKVERVAALARELAPKVGADADLAERAARLAKADLVSEMVYEFPELQGVMGRYYALEAGEEASVADAIADHYQPQGPSNPVPTAPVSIAVALADKLDTLVAFWAIDEKPTGSKDPFALRRSSIGWISLIEENQLRLPLAALVDTLLPLIYNSLDISSPHWFLWRTAVTDAEAKAADRKVQELPKDFGFWEQKSKTEPVVLDEPNFEGWLSGANLIYYDGTPEPGFIHKEGFIEDGIHRIFPSPRVFAPQLFSFFADRLKQYLRDKGERHDLIDAVFSMSPSPDGKGDGPSGDKPAPAEAPRAVSANDDLVLITKRVAALGKFLDSEDGTNLLAGYKRATNILKAEAKKTGETYTGAVNPDLLSEKPEQDLHSSLTTARAKVAEALTTEDFEQAMAAMAPLRGVLDTFFDNVTVNADDTAVRQNRLLLLASMRDALADVADFSRIEG